jgi:hypothetical protein
VLALLALLVAGIPQELRAQTAATRQATAVPARPKSQSWKRPALSVSVGMAFPLSRDPVTRYWNSGLSGSISLLVPAQRSVLVGLAFDASSLAFDEAAFTADYPTVPPNPIDIGVLNLQLLTRVLLRPGMRFSPWIEGALGGAFVTGATYREVVNGLRETYFDVKRTTRLSLSGSVGTEIYFNAALAITIRGKLTYLVNDPSIGVVLVADAGFRFRL